MFFAAMMTLAICALAADSSSPDDLLKSKQLTKIGAYYLLDVDAKLPQSLRAIRQADAQLESYIRRRHYLEDEIEKTDASVMRWSSEMDSIDHQQGGDPKTQNDLIDQHNERVNAIKQGQHYMQQCQKSLQALQVPPDSSSLKLDLLQNMQSTATQYDDLAKDADVTAALAQLNQSSGIKFRLGPSAQFKTELPILQREHDKLTAAPIKLAFSGGVPHVDAVLNDSITKSMVIDSGAAIVSIPRSVADDIGIKLTPDDPKLTLVTANGQQVEARISKIASIRVGPYTVNDVPCAVLPAGTDAECLLGGTFLRHFLYRMDLGTAQLFLTPLASANEKISSKPTPATKPAPQNDPSRLTLEIAATIDGTDVIAITSEGLNWTHKDATWPADVYVNGSSWDPQVNSTLASTNALAFLRKADFTTARVLQKSGRGLAVMQQTDNGLEVDFADPQVGADQYDIKISFALKK
jgi:aspartyl protease family protein